MLQPNYLKRLNENASMMQQQGSSEEEILAMRDAFIKQFGEEEPKKKNESVPSSSLKAPWDSSTPPTLAQSLSAYAEPQKAQASGTSNGTTKQPKTTKPAVEEPKYAEGTMAWNLSKLKTSPYYQEMSTRADSFIAAGNISEEEKQKKTQAVEDEWNSEGVWNNVKRFANVAESLFKERFFTLPSVIPGKGYAAKPTGMNASVAATDPFSKEKKEAKKELLIEQEEAKAQKKIPTPITNESINERAKQIRIKEELNLLKENKQKSFLKTAQTNVDNMGLSEKDKLQRFQAVEYNSLQEENKIELEKQNILRPALEVKLANLNELIVKANNLTKNKTPLSPEMNLEIQQKTKEYNQMLVEATTSYDKFLNTQEKLGTASENLDIFGRDYNWANNFYQNLKASIKEIDAGLFSGVSYGLNMKSNLFDAIGIEDPFKTVDSDKMMISSFTDAVAGDLRAEAEEARQSVAKPTELKSINSLESFGDWLRNSMLATQAPILGAAMTGPGGIAAIGISSTGNAYANMQREMEEGIANYSDSQMATVPLGHGLIDSGQALLESNLFKGASRVINSGTTAERQIMAEGFWKPLGKDLVFGTVKSNAWFTGITISKNILEKYGAGKEDVQITDGLVDSWATATSLGLILPVVSHTFAAAFVKPFSTETRIQKSSDKLVKLEAQLRDPSLSDLMKQETKEAYIKEKENFDKLVKKQVENIKSISNNQLSEISAITKRQAKLRKKAEEIKLDDTGTKESKQRLLDDLAKEFKEIEQRRQDIIKQGPSVALEQLENPKRVQDLKDRAIRQLTQEAKEKGQTEFKFDDSEISRRAIKIHNEEVAAINAAKDAKEGSKKEADNILKNNVDTGDGISRSYDSLEEVPEFLRPLAKKSSKGTRKIGLFGKQEEFQMYNVTLSAKEIKSAYDNFYKTKETKKVQETKPIAKPQEEIIEIPADEIEALKEDVNRAEEEGTLADNVGEKMYRDGKEGMLEINGQQYEFVTSDGYINELGNIELVGNEFIASHGLSTFPPEGMRTEPITLGEKPGILTVDGKEYTFVRQRRPKRGESVIVLKENETGLQRSFSGAKAERILKDIELQKPAKKTTLPLTVEGKEATEPVKTPKEIKREKRLDKVKAKQEFEAKSLEEIEQMQKELDAETAQFEKELLETAAKESEKQNRLMFPLREKEFVVTQKPNGEFSVSQKNPEGKYVGVKDEKVRNEAIDEFKSIKESKDAKRLSDAEDLANQYRKEQNDKILNALDKAVEWSRTVGKGKNQLFEGTLAIPLIAVNSGLKIVRAAYKGGKSLAEAIAEGYKFLKEKGYAIKEHEFKRYILDNINKDQELLNAKEEISDLKAQAKDVIAAEREVGKIEKKEALDKQAEKNSEQVTALKQKIKDGVEKMKQAVVDAKAKGFKAGSAEANKAFYKAKADLIDYARSVMPKGTPNKYNSQIITAIKELKPNNFFKQVQRINDIVDYASKDIAASTKKKLIAKIKEAIDPNSILYKSEAKVKNSKITAEAKENLIKFLDGYKGVDFETLDIQQLTDINNQINDIINNGKAGRKSIKEQQDLVKRTINEEIPVIVSRKTGDVETGRYNLEEELGKGNVVVVDGKTYLPSDLEYVKENMQGEFDGELIVVPKTEQKAQNQYNTSNSFFINLKNGEIKKALFGSATRFVKKQILNISGVKAVYQDLIFDDASSDFLNKHAIQPLESVENRSQLSYGKFVRSLNKLIDTTFGRTKKEYTSIFQVWESETRKKIRTEKNRKQKGTYENTFLTETDLVITDSNGVNTLDKMTEAHVVQLYNELRNPMNIRKFISEGHTIEDVKKVIDHVNNNPKLKQVADSLPGLYSEMLPKLNEALDASGKDTIIPEKYLDSDKTTYAEVLEKFYGDNIPEQIPYVPSAVEPMAEGAVDTLQQFRNYNNSKETLLFGNLYSRQEGGRLIYKPFVDVYKGYAKNVALFTEGHMVLDNMNTLFNGEVNRKVLIKNFGKDWVESAEEKSLAIITGRSEFDAASKLIKGSAKFSSIKNGIQLIVSPVSALGQLSGAVSFSAYIEPSDLKRYTEITFRKGKKNKELSQKYSKMVLNHPLLYDRINKSAHDIDSELIKSMSEGKGFLGSDYVSSTVSDGLYLTVVADATAIYFGGHAVFGLEYEKLLIKYKSEGMSESKAKIKAEDEAMIKMFNIAEKTQASSKKAYAGKYISNPLYRALGLVAFAGPAVQNGSTSIEFFRDAIKKKENKIENLKRGTYFLTGAALLFNLSKYFITSNDDDKSSTGDYSKMSEKTNAYADDFLTQFGFVGKTLSIAKNEIFREHFPSAVGMAKVNRNEKAGDQILRILTQASPTLGAIVRTSKKLIDQKEQYSTFRQTLAGVETFTNIPTDKLSMLTMRAVNMFNNDYKFADRVSILLGKINETSMLKYEDRIKQIQESSAIPINKSMTQEERDQYYKIPSDEEAELFKQNAEMNHQVEYIEKYVNLLKEKGIDGYEKEVAKEEAKIETAREEIKEKYIEPAVEAMNNKDYKTAISINKEFKTYMYKLYEEDRSTFDVVAKTIKETRDNVMEEKVAFLKDVKKASPGRARAIAIYERFGDLTTDRDRIDRISISVLVKLNVIDESTAKEYVKYIRENK
jgi:hypothetical protein